MAYASRTYSVYALAEPTDMSVRYVGQTYNLRLRYSTHKSPSALQKDTPLSRWLRRLRREELNPRLLVLDEGLSYMAVSDREEWWIDYFSSSEKSQLLNCTYRNPHDGISGRPYRNIVGIFRGGGIVAELLECGHCLRKLACDHHPSKRGSRSCYRCRDASEHS